MTSMRTILCVAHYWCDRSSDCYIMSCDHNGILSTGARLTIWFHKCTNICIHVTFVLLIITLLVIWLWSRLIIRYNCQSHKCAKNIIESPCYMECHYTTMLHGSRCTQIMLLHHHVTWIVAQPPCCMVHHCTMLCGLHCHRCIHIISVDDIVNQINHLTMPQINNLIYQINKDHQAFKWSKIDHYTNAQRSTITLVSSSSIKL